MLRILALVDDDSLGLRWYQLHSTSEPRHDPLPKLSRIPRLPSALPNRRCRARSNNHGAHRDGTWSCPTPYRWTANLRTTHLRAARLWPTNLRATTCLRPTDPRYHFSRLSTRIRSAYVREIRNFKNPTSWTYRAPRLSTYLSDRSIWQRHHQRMSHC